MSAVVPFVASCLLLFAALDGRAQPAPPSESLLRLKQLSVEELSEVRVVTTVASLNDAGELDVGSTVEAVGRESWRRRGARTVADAVGHLPGILVAPSFFGGSILSIRGFTNTPGVRGIATRLDGVPVNNLQFGSALYDLHSLQLGTLERIEMIRGPGSALYGADAFHGVLSLKTFESEADVTEAEAGFGNDLYREGALRLSRGLKGGGRVDGAAAYNGQPGQSRSYGYTLLASGALRSSAREEEFESFMGVLKLRSAPGRPASGRLGLVLKGQNQERFPGIGRLLSAQMSASDFAASDSRFALVHGALERDLPHGLSAEAKAHGWADSSRRFREPHSDLEASETRAGGQLLLRQSENSLFTPWQAGYEYGRQEVTEARENQTVAPDDGYTRQVHGLLLQAHTELWDDTLRLLYGARYDAYSDADDHLSPRAGLIVKPAPGWAVKLLYGNAFRPPTTSEARGTGTVAPASGRPETLDTWELAVLRQGQRHRAFAVLFATRWLDAIVSAKNPGPGKPSAFLNIGESRSRGAEAGGTWLGSGWRADLSGSYVESEDRTNTRAYAAFPRVLLNAGAGLEVPGRSLEFYLHNRVHLGAREGPVRGTVPSPQKLKDYWRADLSCTWRRPGGGAEVYVNVLNLLDRRNFFPAISAAEGGLPDRGLTLLTGLRLRWGAGG